jgi:tetratricopeptide (TPR) repeat protein
MKRFVSGLALIGVTLLLAASLASAQSTVTYRDWTKNDQETPARGTIKKESSSEIVVKPTIGPEKTIPAVKIIDIVYEVPQAIRSDYGRANTAELIGADAKKTAAQRRQGLNDALSEFQKLVPKAGGAVELERHFRWKVASLTARLAGDDKAQNQAAIKLLEDFKKNHSAGWQIISCVRTLSDLYVNLTEFEKAVAAFDDLKRMPGISEETKVECDRRAAECLVRIKKHGEAADRLTKVLATMKPGTAAYEELDNQRLLCLANTPAKYQQAVAEFRKRITAAKEPVKLAIAHNALGECFLMNNDPKSAVYEFLYVDLIYNQDREQHKRAVEKLVQAFKELKQPDRSREYADKLDKMK